MEKTKIIEELAEVPPGLRPLVEDLLEHWPVEYVQHRWRRSGGRGRYRSTGTDISIGARDTAEDVVLAVLALAEEVDDEEGAPVQHQARWVRGDEHGRWHRWRLTAPTSQDIAEAATRFAAHCERVAVRAMGYLEQQLRLQAEMGRELAHAMRPAVQLRRLELEHELARHEAEQRAAQADALREMVGQALPLLAQLLARSAGGGGSEDPPTPRGSA